MMAFLNQRRQLLSVLGQVPAVVAGQLPLSVWHKGGLMRPHLTDKVHEVVKRIALNVELTPGTAF